MSVFTIVNRKRYVKRKALEVGRDGEFLEKMIGSPPGLTEKGVRGSSKDMVVSVVRAGIGRGTVVRGP